MHRARLTRQAQNSHPSCRGRRPRRPVNSIKNAASGGIFTLSRGAERPNCDRPRSGHLSGRTRAPKASGRGGRGRNVGASVPAQKRFSLGLHPVSLGKTKETGWIRQHQRKDIQLQTGEFLPANPQPPGGAGTPPLQKARRRFCGSGTQPVHARSLPALGRLQSLQHALYRRLGYCLRSGGIARQARLPARLKADYAHPRAVA